MWALCVTLRLDPLRVVCGLSFICRYELQWERIDWRFKVLDELTAMLTKLLRKEMWFADSSVVSELGLVVEYVDGAPVAPGCAVLCCAVLCCAVLCCAVLCCAVLCCAAFVALRATD